MMIVNGYYIYTGDPCVSNSMPMVSSTDEGDYWVHLKNLLGIVKAIEKHLGIKVVWKEGEEGKWVVQKKRGRKRGNVQSVKN